jgi:hypothetical protein
MTREEILKRIKELEDKEFLIHMIDHWREKDRRELFEIERELKELRKLI